MALGDLQKRLEAALGSRVVESSPLSLGFGLSGLAVKLANGRRLAVKAQAEAPDRKSHLEIEGYMLRELARNSGLPVPRVHYVDPSLLVMDFIETDGGGITPRVESHAGELIARLHAVQRDGYGYERDTLIGPLSQPNPRSREWIPFFRDQRLMLMARQAQQEGRLPRGMLGRIERLAERLDDYLSEPAAASLLHGDLWTGNVLVRGDRIAGFVDPAIYYGHPEIELAFTTLFATFGEAFFEAYESVSPLEPGFHEVRRNIYNLYPRLVHVRLFGSGYLDGIDRTLARLGF
jgi:fructosamine-3-kinase